jgi:hypothetical protein
MCCSFSGHSFSELTGLAFHDVFPGVISIEACAGRLLVALHDEIYWPCSAALISTAYQPWYSVFLSQQNSHSRLISCRNSLPNRVINDDEPSTVAVSMCENM